MEKSHQKVLETDLSKDQLKVLKEAFNAFDKDKTGHIPTDVVGTILELLGHKLSEEELEEVIDEYDEDESGQIEFNEFVELASNYVEPEEDYDALRKELREVFMMYDKDAKGYIPLDTFKQILRELDGAVPEEEPGRHRRDAIDARRFRNSSRLLKRLREFSFFASTCGY
ncbi:hypothetical protein pipiens_010746 [Culex pipiens pipiens]|uniref:EF-hand domain-containing protein n=1 Tax=Culex pipiens pipiens TaxID=38569 RepID=A0ABD1D905_CULPP